ncbi:MAG: hypothetical protein AAGC93_08595 [Cyanobacteria bacterium P01_F01_bin.53]
MKKHILIPSSIAALLITVTVPALGFGGLSLSDVVHQAYTDLFRLGQEEIIAVTGDDFAPFDSLIGVNPLTGTLETLESREALIKAHDPAGIIDETPGSREGRELANILDQEAARQRAEPIIGEAGQPILQDKLNHTSDALARIQAATEATFNATSTQESIKYLSQLNLETAELLAAMRLEMMDARVDSQYQSLNMANLSETLDEERRERLLNEEAYLRRLIKRAENFTLF